MRSNRRFVVPLGRAGRSNIVRVLFTIVIALTGRPSDGWAQMEERAIYVSGLDQSGAAVPNLSAGDLVVSEDGVPREVLRVSAATAPFQIAVLVDTSQSMQPFVSEVQSALKWFFREIQDRHERALFTLGDRPTIVADYSRDPARLEAGIGRLFGAAGHGGPVLDAIIEISRGLRQRGATRPVIVVVLAEDCPFGLRDAQTVLNDLGDIGVALHAYVLPDAGGHTLAGRLQRLAAELNNQFLVIYARPRSATPPDVIDVSARRAGVIVGVPPVRQEPGGACWIVERGTSRNQEFFGYQCRQQVEKGTNLN